MISPAVDERIDETEVSQATFASLMFRSSSAVRHWIANGRISSQALVRRGKRVLILRLRAQADLRANLAPGQQRGQLVPLPTAPMPTANAAALPQANAFRPPRVSSAPRGGHSLATVSVPATDPGAYDEQPRGASLLVAARLPTF